jgi:hypothetical protein
MENPKNKLTPKEKQFLDGLSEYLDTTLFYYGSIQRDDYIPGKSDIDVNIFTDNEASTISKLQHYLHVQRKEFQKIVWKVYYNDKVVTGYKLKYKNSFIILEISIYNIKYKSIVLNEHNSKMKLPFHSHCLLYIIKILFYVLRIIPASVYVYIKHKIFTIGLGLPDDQFVLL